MNEIKKDPNFIFKLERNIKAYMLYTIIILAFTSIILSLSIMFLTPLKETKPYLVFFSDAQTNFVKIKEANLDIRKDTALLKNILAGYVKNRELINRIDDIQRYEIIRIQSSKPVWEAFSNLVKAKNSIYTTQNLYRDIQIINVSILNDFIATIDFVAQQSNRTKTTMSYKKYRATLKYNFEAQEDNYNSVIKNPTGFIVDDYAITDIIEEEKQ